MSTDTEVDTRRISIILGMLGSEHVGERAAAGLKADQMVRAAGLTWDSLVAVRRTDEASERDWREPDDLATAIEVARRYQDHFNRWERRFIESVDARELLTTKQIKHIERLVDRARGIAFRPADYPGFD